MTLEDETAFVNVVVWSRVFEENVVLVKTSSFLGFTGRVQNRDGIVHVIAETVRRPPAHRPPKYHNSRPDPRPHA